MIEETGFAFPDGLIYEDLLAHFVLLLKRGVSLLDRPVCYYRVGRKGQITGRVDRTNFQIFEILRRVHSILFEQNASHAIWAMGLWLELQFCKWLYSKVPPEDRDDYLDQAASAFRRVPGGAVRAYLSRFPWPADSLPLLCFRRGWRLPSRAAIGWSQTAAALRERATAALRRVLPCWVRRLVRPKTADQTFGGERLLKSPPGSTGWAGRRRRVCRPNYCEEYAILQPGDTVVDVGRHVGEFCIPLAKRCPFVRVLAIEPEESNYRDLLRNIAASGVTNIEVVQVAVATKRERRTLYVDGRAHLLDNSSARRSPRLIPDAVPCRSSATPCRESCTRCIEHAKILKINARGWSVKFGTCDGQIEVGYLCGRIERQERH